MLIISHMIQAQYILLSLWIFLSFGCAHSQPQENLISCFGRADIQKIKSARLQEIAKADQDDRSAPYDSINWNKVSPRDIKRRIEIGEIFALGCFSSAADYAAGAILYQHGDTADHAYQAFLWSLRGVELGDATQKWLLGASLDRYLVRVGKKQLFATQYSRPLNESCWCIEQVESSFSEERRVESTNKTLDHAISKLKEMNTANSISVCKNIKFCKSSLKDSPKGTVPGFW